MSNLNMQKYVVSHSVGSSTGQNLNDVNSCIGELIFVIRARTASAADDKGDSVV